MRTAVFGISTSLLLACAPDWSANETTRCTESAECGEAQLCYRGFCVLDPDAGVPEEEADAGADASTISTRPAAPSSVPASAPGPTTSPGTTTSAAATASPADAGSPGDDEGDDSPEVPDAGAADASSAGTRPSGAHDAGSSAKPPATQPNPPANPNPGPAPKAPATTPPAPSADAGAAEPEIPGDCTLAKCCEEALKALEREEKEGDDAKGARGPGKCGCAEPELLRVLGCGILAPVGALL